MTTRHITRARLASGVALGALVLGLAGCDGLESVTGSDAAPAAALAAERGELRIEERDVEAPDVFALSDRGLWDGRPSLGGIWVAVPQRVEPDRVKITNRDTGREVIGGLFRKEVETPGPPILVSADAAAALGMQAGAPADLDLVVLRRETVEIRPPAPAAPAETGSGSEAVAEPEAAPPAEGEAGAVAEAAPAAEGEIAASALAPAGEAPAPEAASTPRAAARPAPDRNPQAVTFVPLGELDRPYVQVATLGSAARANAVVRELQAAGLSAELRVTERGGRRSFSVVVGPAMDEAERSDILRRVRGLGYADAYPV